MESLLHDEEFSTVPSCGPGPKDAVGPFLGGDLGTLLSAPSPGNSPQGSHSWHQTLGTHSLSHPGLRHVQSLNSDSASQPHVSSVEASERTACARVLGITRTLAEVIPRMPLEGL